MVYFLYIYYYHSQQSWHLLHMVVPCITDRLKIIVLLLRVWKRNLLQYILHTFWNNCSMFELAYFLGPFSHISTSYYDGMQFLHIWPSNSFKLVACPQSGSEKVYKMIFSINTIRK
jgi:hypothetical protein